MSEKEYSLDGKLVTVFLDGPWEFHGRVEFAAEDKIVLTSDLGSMVIYRESIMAAMIHEEEKELEELIDPELGEKYNVVVPQDGWQTLEQADYYGAAIPADMLLEGEDSYQVDLSLSMSGLKNPQPKQKYRSNNDSIEKDEDAGKEGEGKLPQV